jgi:SHO1 osmosensor
MLTFPPDTASPDDPDELSFIQGETLDIPDTHRDIHDMSGFWWQARKMDGTIGCEDCRTEAVTVY